MSAGIFMIKLCARCINDWVWLRLPSSLFGMLCTIWYHLCNLKICKTPLKSDTFSKSGNIQNLEIFFWGKGDYILQEKSLEIIPYFLKFWPNPTNVHFFKVNNRDTRERCEIWRRAGVFIFNLKPATWL